jgi:hypothetical protein
MRRTILATFAFVLVPLAAIAQEPEKPIDRPVDAAFIAGLAQKIEPELKGSPDRLDQYVNHFRHESTHDARFFAFKVFAEAEGEHGVRLHGYVEFPETRNALVAYFKKLGFDPVDSQLETLPSKELGEKRFGFIKADHSLSYMEPEEREVVTDCLLGEALFLLREEADHFLVHGGDGYLGWVAAKDVHRVDEKEFAKYLDGPRVCVNEDVALKDGVNTPAGSRLKFVREDGDDYVFVTPEGDEHSVSKKSADLRDLPKEKIEAICKGAKALLGTKYLWGGKTSRGVDCSGLVQVSFAGAGLVLARDASQQFDTGKMTGTRWSRAAMRRGDTLYFLNPQGKISHTGLYLGDDKFIHAVSPVVRINSFNPKDKEYDPARHTSFAFARRLCE